jgi:hypothetical protein
MRVANDKDECMVENHIDGKLITQPYLRQVPGEKSAREKDLVKELKRVQKQIQGS